MKFIIETSRLILRELYITDDAAMFELDSNPDVHRYLGNNPVTSIEQSRSVIAGIQKQYKDNGIGRWATIEKSTGRFIGWSGLKFITEPENNHVNFYDVGFRFIPEFWGNGYATESAKAALEYGFTKLNANEIIGTAHEENKASRRALEKCGLKYIEKFQWKNLTCDRLSISRQNWEKIYIIDPDN
jgi:ribosomal-protein-alanine N-acetyltransferase